MQRWSVVILTLLLWVNLAVGKDLSKKAWVQKDMILYNKGMKAFREGNYKVSLSLFQKSLKIRKIFLDSQSTSTAESYNNIAYIYKILGNNTNALEYSKKALEIYKYTYGSKSIPAANNYNNIAMLYIALGDYSKAVKYLLSSLEILEKLLGKGHIDTATVYDNIASIYQKTGDYPKALRFYKKALEIREKILGKESLPLARSYNSFGEINLILKNYHKALSFFLQSLNIRKKILGKEHIDTAESMNNVGATYAEEGDYSKALKYYIRSLNIVKKKLGKEHPSTATILDNIGNIYLKAGNNTEALKYLQEALGVKIKILGGNHIDTGIVYNNLGSYYLTIKDNIKALEYFKKALTVFEQKLGEEHPFTVTVYHSINLVYQRMDDYPMAYQYAQKSFNGYLANRDLIFTILDHGQKENYLQSNVGLIGLLLTSSYSYIKQLDKENNSRKSQDILYSGANAWLNYKGSIFDSENAIATLCASTKDENLKVKINDLVSSKRYLAKLYQTLPKPKEKEVWQKNIKKTEEKISALTNEIASKATSFKEQQGLKSVTYKDITSHLKENELYIDYAKIENNYYLFALDNKNNINFKRIDQNNTKEIDTFIKTFRDDIHTILVDNNISKEKLKDLTQSSKNKLSKLYDLVIKRPLGDTIKNKTDLVISPDGALRLLPFETLYDKENNKYFIEEKEIRYIPSGKELVRLYMYAKDKVSKEKKDAVIFANPNFNTTLKSKHRGAVIITPNTSRSGIIKSLFTMRFPPLPGTQAEAKEIKTILGSNVKEYNKDKATESALIQIKEPSILHIATHGFFINDNTIPNPMLKSGIALTGANASAIHGKSDGIVTALKLSGVDLKGTDLVVLSACETGVVDINSTDSVSGLSKAFIQAGAKDVVMSLWSVDDQATKELMGSFYRQMKASKRRDYAKALKEAKLKMIEEGRHPFYWAAFVVSGL